MSAVALVLYLVGLLVLFGVRTWLHMRRTGTSGISGPPGSLRWWAGVLFVLALVLEVLALALAVTGSVPAPELPPAVAAAGLVLALTGFLGVLAAQTGMGASWRIGVRETERTDLVTGGLFAVVRNPIFTLMVLGQGGFVLMVPTAPSLAALACLVAAVELQVRLIEEPYLLRVHGSAYRGYAAATGRFVPGLGRLEAALS